MHPTSLFSFPASPVFLRRLVILLLSSTLVLFLAGSALAQIDNPRPIVADAFTAGAWEPSELPDVAVVLSGVDADDPRLETRVIPELQQLRGVVGVVGEVAPSGRIALHISLAAGISDSVLPEISTAVENAMPDAQVSLGGRAVADRDLLDRLNRGMIVAVVPVVVLLTVLITAGLGVRFGLAVGGTVGLSVLLGGLVGSSVAGSFDGSLATTAVPAVLVAVLVSSVLSFRLLDWFKEPFVGDQAEAIRQSVRHIAPEAALLFGGLIATAIILQLAGGSTPTTVVAIGGLFASLVTFGALPALLATMGAVPDEEEYKLFKLNGPDGRDFPLAVLGGFACFLLVMGLFAIRVPDSTLMDESALPQGVTSRRVSEQLVELGGDPSSAVLAEIALGDPDTDGVVENPQPQLNERELADWALAVSALPSVGWVETATGRYAGGALVSAPVSSTSFTTATATMAIVTPIITPRSTGAIELVSTLDSMSGEMLTTEFVLSGSAVDASATTDGATLRLWLLVGLLAITGALAVLLLVNDLVLAGLTLALRLIGTMALLGVYYLVAGDVGVVELQVAALIFSVGVGLFEIGFLRRIRDDVAASLDSVAIDVEADTDASTDVVNAAFRREGRAAMLGLAVTALCGLGLLSNDLVVARQLGVAVAAGVVIELLIGTWLLRPAVLGERSIVAGLGGSMFDVTGLNGNRSARFHRAIPTASDGMTIDLTTIADAQSETGTSKPVSAKQTAIEKKDSGAMTLTNAKSDSISDPKSESNIESTSLADRSSQVIDSGKRRLADWSADRRDEPKSDAPVPEAWLPKLLMLVRDSLLETGSSKKTPAETAAVRAAEGRTSNASDSESTSSPIEPTEAKPAQPRPMSGPKVPVPIFVDNSPPPPKGKMLAQPASRDSYQDDTSFGTGATAFNEPPSILARTEPTVPFEGVGPQRRTDSLTGEAKTSDPKKLLPKTKSDGPSLFDIRPNAKPSAPTGDSANENAANENAANENAADRISIAAPATLEEHPAGASRSVSIRASDSGDPEWRRIVANLLRQEFAFQVEPLKAELETVFVSGTPLFGELLEHNKRLRSSGLQVRGEGPVLQKVTLVNDGSPVTVAITVDHPQRQLLDQSGRLLGTRPQERRDGMLWLIQDPSGRYRIAEAVDLGTSAAIDLDDDSSAPSSDQSTTDATPIRREAKRGAPSPLI